MYLYFVLVLALSPTLLFGYLDPGTGTVLINLLIAGVMAGIYSLKSIFLKIIGKGKSDKNLTKPARISIFSEGKQYWDTFQPIVNAFIDRKISFHYYTLDIHDPGLTIENDYMSSHFLGYGAWALSKASLLQAEFLLSTTPNIGTTGYPIRRSPHVKEMIHIFHSINDISMYRTGSLDHYDTVYMAGDFQAESIREIERVRNLKEKKLIPLGLPYIDKLVESVIQSVAKEPTKTVVIGSSWGTKGCLQSYGTDFIRDIALAGYRVIVRPHPQSLLTEQHLLKQYKQALQDLPNVIWDETISPANAMSQADVLVSDTSSLRYDFAFLYEKPVITLTIKAGEMPNFERTYLSKIWDDTAGSQIGTVLTRDQLPQLVSIIQQSLEKHDISKLREFREQTLCNFGKAGEAIAGYMETLVEGETDVS